MPNALRSANLGDKAVKANRLKQLVVMSALALAPGLTWAAPGGTGLAGTDHDFTTNANLTQAIGLCTFCHTPHKANSTLLLWNHTLSSNSFSWDVTATTAGTTLPTLVGNSYKGTSAKCLSCHDGSVAIGDVYWFAEQANQGVNALTPDKMGDLDPSGGHTIGAGGNMAGNHPVGVPYPLNNVANTYNGITTGAGAVLTEWQADPVSLAQANIRLFDNPSGTNFNALPRGSSSTTAGIECSTCHDPHNKASVEDLFLRGKLTGATQGSGYICLQCHIK